MGYYPCLSGVPVLNRFVDRSGTGDLSMCLYKAVPVCGICQCPSCMIRTQLALVHWELAGITRFIGAPKHDGDEFNSTHNTHPTFTSLHASAMKASTMREAVGHSCKYLSQKVSLT